MVTNSQHLVEGTWHSAETQNPTIHLLEYTQGFEFVFTKNSFDVLPEHYYWDHTIKLILGSDPKLLKIYPLSPVEKTKLDIFLEKNLYTGCIYPSKSPIAALVFFIKKKNGSL